MFLILVGSFAGSGADLPDLRKTLMGAIGTVLGYLFGAGAGAASGIRK